jgi:glucokinase
MSGEFAIGIDIGGTSIVGAVVAHKDGRILARQTIPTDSQRGIENGLARLTALVAALLAEAQMTAANLDGIGIGATAPVDSISGRIHNPYTLPGWDGIPVVDHLSAAFGVPALLLGDCQVAALGEHWQGAGRGAQKMLYVTVGTGIGAGFIVDGRLYRGVGDASEVGHQVIDIHGPKCYCGAQGCWEMLASGPAIARMAAAEAPDDSLLMTLASGDRERLSAKLLTEAAAQGDAFALRLVERVGFYFGVGAANLINILAPNALVFGGGVMQGWDSFAPSLLKTVGERGGMVQLEAIRIVPAQLGLNAGVTGAARAVWMRAAGEL